MRARPPSPIVLALLLAGGFAGPAAVAAAETIPVYDITPIADLGPGGETTPLGLGGDGVVVGRAKLKKSTKDADFVAFAWARGRSAVLQSGNAHGAQANAIAADDTAIGTTNFASISGGPSGWSWTRDSRHKLAGTSTADAVTPTGLVVGTSGLETYSYDLATGTYTGLGHAPGNFNGEIGAVSVSGEYIAGQGAPVDGQGFYYEQLTLWHLGTWTSLGYLAPDVERVDAHGVNDWGWICGALNYYVSDQTGGHYVTRGFIRKPDGALQTWGALVKEYFSEARGMNGDGWVVGSDQEPGSPLHAIGVTPGGTLFDLTTQLAPGNDGWQLQSATAINARGQIVGTGTLAGQPTAFLLTPRR